MLEIFLVFWPSFTLGILHSLQPCEDKAIFSFYAFGVSRDWKDAFKLLNLYGAGLLSANLAIGLVFTIIGATILTYVPPVPLAVFGGGVTIFAGIFMFWRCEKEVYDPHSRQKQEIGTSLTRKTNSAYGLGMLASIPPCVMELIIYIQATTYAAEYGILSGLLAVFYFGIGTWIGLYPLGIIGFAGSRAKAKVSSPWRLAKITAVLMIILGGVYLVLALLGINLFPTIV
ncbi:MAG TPA: sulfite exporter TauE/SafE family protein [Candidatus Lokiarchaeia archaeon]|nr:sulfite exporter TauE/SafE family protein [Candidatus Lokiarchaeia archaeon]